jgi:hypothetical protein
MNKTATTIFLVLWTLTVPTAYAERVLLDDSLSPRQNYAVDLTWDPQSVGQALGALFEDQSAALPPLTGYLSAVEIRLDTSRYVGQRARIFMSFPANITGDNSGGTLGMAWEARGQFESGSMLPGQAVLIFEGPIDAPIVSGTFDFAISIGSAGHSESFSFELVYELEVIN